MSLCFRCRIQRNAICHARAHAESIQWDRRATEGHDFGAWACHYGMCELLTCVCSVGWASISAGRATSTSTRWTTDCAVTTLARRGEGVIAAANARPALAGTQASEARNAVCVCVKNPEQCVSFTRPNNNNKSINNASHWRQQRKEAKFASSKTQCFVGALVVYQNLSGQYSISIVTLFISLQIDIIFSIQANN